MATERYDQLPTTTAAQLTDIICAVQGYSSPSALGTSVQETWAQVLALFQSGTLLSYAGNPNGAVAGSIYILCWDTSEKLLWVCTATGSSSTAVWTPCIGALTNGQLRIGNTGNAPTAATLTAGTGISIANGAGSITISATSEGAWVNQTTAGPVTMAVATGYTANNSDNPVIFDLPTIAAVGDYVEVNGGSSAEWRIGQSAGQSIKVGNITTTTGATGYIQSTNQYDSVRLRCITANTDFAVASMQSAGLTVN